MRYLVQHPHPDELLGSVWIRTRRRAGVGIGLVTKVIAGRKFSPGLLSFSHVSDVAGALGVDAQELLWKHTVFPYATAFVEPQVFKSSMASALSTGMAAIGCGATVQSVSGHVQFRRYCVRCAKEDLLQWGESYWRRAHHLPGTLLCVKHLEPLRETTVNIRKSCPWPDSLPHELKAPNVPVLKGDVLLKALAQRSFELLNRAEQSPLQRQPSWYRTKLVDHGLLSADRPVESESLKNWARGSLGEHIGHLGLNRIDQSCHWLPLMVRPAVTIPFVPFKHAIFETLLELSEEPSAPILDYIPSGLTAKPTKAADIRFAAALKKVLKGVRERGERVRVRDALAAAGCGSAFRHASSKFPRVQALVLQLRESEFSVRPISRPATF